jgi:putative ABC transport system permease protein
VVGVAGDVKTSAQETPREQIYQVITAELMFGGTALIVSAQGDARDLIGGIKGQAWSLDPKLPMKDIETVEARISASLARPRFNLVLLSVFAGIGLTLAMIGIYGVISYAVGVRTQEIGVRMALGALPSDIRRAVLGEALMLSAVGVAVGLAGSLVLTRMLKSLLFEVSATDPLTLISVALLLLSAASLAAWIPARRAMRVDPMVALRAD